MYVIARTAWRAPGQLCKIDIKQMRKEPLRLCRYMLDSFLENNTVLGINYSYNNPNYPSNKCFDIITIKGIFTTILLNLLINKHSL